MAELNVQPSPSLTEESSTCPAEPFNPTPGDIHHTIFLLNTLLRLSVPSLTSAIINFAQYHHRSLVYSTEERTIAEYPHRSDFVPYLTTPPIEGVGRRPVHKIVFEGESHDQGWCSNPNAGNWTWWDAAAYSFREQDIARSAGRHGQQTAAVESDHGAKFKELPRLYINQLANREFTRWRVTVCASDIHSSEPEERRRAEWLQSLRQGDVVCLIPRAMFPGWMHYIKSGRIEVSMRYCL